MPARKLKALREFSHLVLSMLLQNRRVAVPFHSLREVSHVLSDVPQGTKVINDRIKPNLKCPHEKAHALNGCNTVSWKSDLFPVSQRSCSNKDMTSVGNIATKETWNPQCFSVTRYWKSLIEDYCVELTQR